MSALRKTGCGIIVRDKATMEPLFDLIIYGIDMPQLTNIVEPPAKLTQAALDVIDNTGGWLVRRALKRKGLDPEQFVCSPFDTFYATVRARDELP